MSFLNDMKYKKNPIVSVDGAIEEGTQFDLEIVLPKDNRDAIFGVVLDSYKNPVADAVVKLIEIETCECKIERKPVSHTFTDKCGEFVFGPLCPDKKYEIIIWATQIKNEKICARPHRDTKCLKGICLDVCDFEMECEKDFEKCECENKCDKDFDKCKCDEKDFEKCKCDEKCKCEDKCEKDFDKCKCDKYNYAK